MEHTDISRLHDLIDRLNRITSAADWGDGLNPAQRSTLRFLSRANRFSRSPSHVANYLCATRGTVSQTLKALERKGMIQQVSSAQDRRSTSYDVTDLGHEVLTSANELDQALLLLEPAAVGMVASGIEQVMMKFLERRKFRQFGICKACKHHQSQTEGPYCALLETPLQENEANQLCHEYRS